MSLPRSKAGMMCVSTSDFRLLKKGVKTMTSRYGDKREDYKVGQIIEVEDNKKGLKTKVRIHEVVIKSLRDVTCAEAKAISNYSVEDHIKDFTSIYRDKLGKNVNDDTLLTLVTFSEA